MRKEILLVFFCFAVLASMSFVSAAVNSSYVTVGSPATYSFSSHNTSTSVLLNVTFQDSGTAGIGSGGDLDVSGKNLTLGLFNVSVTFYAKSSNATFVTIGYINSATETTARCFQGRNATEWGCWKTFTINSSLDGLWTISANVTNSSGSWTGSGANTSGNATNVLFDSTPPRVTFLVNSAGTNLAGTNQSGVLININVSVNDSKSGTYAWTNDRNDSVGIIGGTVRMNITNSAGTNITYVMNNVTNTNGSAFMFNYTINTSHLGDSGTYTVTIWANDSLNNMNKSESFSFTLDKLNPSITGVKAANTTQTVLYATISVNDVLTGLNGVCTTDRAGDSVSGTGLTNAGIKTLYLAETGLNCGTTYSYAFTCTSYAGNAKTTTLSFATANCQGSAAGGGGGGTTTTPTWAKTIVVSEDQISSTEGSVSSLAANNRVEVKIGGAKHHIGVTQLTATSATVVISSNPVTVKLDVGQDARVDLDQDGVYDLYVKLNSIADNKADVIVKKIEEQIPEGEGAVSTTGEQVTAESEVPEGAVEEEDSGSSAWIWIVVVVVILVLVGAGFAVKKRK